MARVREVPSRAEQLALERTVTADDRATLALGAAEWDRRAFFDAHEVWEEVWHRERRPMRSFYQGLILLAAGLHHWTGTHRPRGVRIKLASGIERLAPYAPSYLGVDVSGMVTDAAVLLRRSAGLDAAGLASTSAVDPTDLFPPFRWTGSAPNVEELRVKRLRAAALLPQRGSAQSSGLDLFAELSESGGSLMLGTQPQLVPTGIAAAAPSGCELQVRPRSGLSRRGVEVAWGTVDADYRGELLVTMSIKGASGRGYRVEQGDRIAQLVVAPVSYTDVIEVEALDQTERGSGGFGSTGR